MNFYKRYPGDYARDTAHLSLAEHGAYTVLLDIYYGTEKQPPAQAPALHRLCRCSNPEECAAVDSIVAQFFTVTNDRLIHNRVEGEIKRTNELRVKNKVKGKLGGERSAAARAAATTTSSSPGLNLAIEKIQANQTTRLPDVKTLPPADAGGVADEPAAPVVVPPIEEKLPDCPHEQIIALYHELMPTNPRVESWGDQRQGYLRARWREKSLPYAKHPGYKTLAEGLEYWRRFFRYASSSRFLTGRTEGTGGRPPFVADLEWLVRPTNFAKVIEGKYP